ncbi:MAG: hypothetical protein H7210_09695 [Pyrinomonadaceae bacterium]|nr:hypothetical protein [Phycisphaerales bacterium]
MTTKPNDPKNQKTAPGAEPGKNTSRDGAVGTMSPKSGAQAAGTRQGQQDGANKDRSAGKPDSQTLDRKTNDAGTNRDKAGSKAGDQTGKAPGRDTSRDSKSNATPGNDAGSKKARIEGNTDEDTDQDELGKPTGMADTRVSNAIDEDNDQNDDQEKITDDVQRSDRAKNANGGSNKPR